jgi:hypothetical protein
MGVDGTPIATWRAMSEGERRARFTLATGHDPPPRTTEEWLAWFDFGRIA